MARSSDQNLVAIADSANHQWLWQIVNTLRGVCDSKASALLSLLILAWAKRSVSKQLDREIRANGPSPKTSDEFIKRMEAALNICFDTEIGSTAPITIDSQYQSLPIEVLIDVLACANHLASRKQLSLWIPPLELYSVDKNIEQNDLVPDEVVSLMSRIALDKTTHRVYCPYDDFARFSMCTSLMGAQAHLECTKPTNIPKLSQILSGLPFDIAFQAPLLIGKVNEPTDQFDVAVAFAPMGRLSRNATIHVDWIQQLPKKTSSQAIYAILHILSRSKHKAVVAVPNNVLFSKGSEKDLRRKLIEQRMISAVVSMPPALLPYTVIPFSILVLTPEGDSTKVRFVDGSSEQFFTKDGRNRSTLTEWESLLRIYTSSTDNALVKDVTIEEIIENDYHLEVSRYVLSDELQTTYDYIYNLASHYQIKKLVDCAEIIRPSIRLYENGNTKAFEFVASDFPQFGYLTLPSKEVRFCREAVDTKEKKLFLRPHDIVISVKGVTGAVAIAPPNTPPPGENGWFVNQSCLILRAKEDTIDPVYLFMYLSSDMGQVLLNQISIGAATPLIQLQSLKNISIPLPPLAEMKDTTTVFKQQAALQQQIQNLVHQQHQLSQLHWHLKP